VNVPGVFSTNGFVICKLTFGITKVVVGVRTVVVVTGIDVDVVVLSLRPEVVVEEVDVVVERTMTEVVDFDEPAGTKPTGR